MKRLLCLLFAAWGWRAGEQSLLPGYNAAFYPTALASAKGVAMPFLLRQGYAMMPGVTVTDSTLHYGASDLVVHQAYQNGGTGYTLSNTQYAAYGLSSMSKVWPYGLPNILYNPATNAWDCIGDCVSYVMRVLAATGDTSVANNAYLNLRSLIKSANTTNIASKGYSSTAYQLGCAFATLGAGDANGWQYIAGNVLWDSVDATNHYYKPTVGTYNGVAKGGFASAKAGDVLAYSFPRTASFNGHLMILESAPQLLGFDSLKAFMPAQSAANVNSLLAKYKVYAVPVFDCSGKKAHFRDSRQTVSGVGHGSILMLASITGDVPKGFIFGAGSVSGSTISCDTIGVDVFALSVGRWRSSASVSVEETVKSSELRAWPNPLIGEALNVWSEADGEATLLNAAAAPVATIKLQAAKQQSIYVGRLPPGAYFLQCQSRGRMSVSRLLKQ